MNWRAIVPIALLVAIMLIVPAHAKWIGLILGAVLCIFFVIKHAYGTNPSDKASEEHDRRTSHV